MSPTFRDFKKMTAKYYRGFGKSDLVKLTNNQEEIKKDILVELKTSLAKQKSHSQHNIKTSIFLGTLSPVGEPDHIWLLLRNSFQIDFLRDLKSRGAIDKFNEKIKEDQWAFASITYKTKKLRQYLSRRVVLKKRPKFEYDENQCWIAFGGNKVFISTPETYQWNMLKSLFYALKQGGEDSTVKTIDGLFEDMIKGKSSKTKSNLLMQNPKKKAGIISNTCKEVLRKLKSAQYGKRIRLSLPGNTFVKMTIL